MKHPPPPPRLRRKRPKPPPRRQPRRPAPERGHPPPAVQVAWERRQREAHLQRLAREQIQARELEEALDRWRHTPSTTWEDLTDANPTASGRVVIRIYYGPTVTNFY